MINVCDLDVDDSFLLDGMVFTITGKERDARVEARTPQNTNAIYYWRWDEDKMVEPICGKQQPLF
jgi:hypothetical protein